MSLGKHSFLALNPERWPNALAEALATAGWSPESTNKSWPSDVYITIPGALQAVTGVSPQVIYNKTQGSISAADLFLKYQSIKLDNFSPVVFQAAASGTNKLIGGQAYGLVYTEFTDTEQKCVLFETNTTSY